MDRKLVIVARPHAELYEYLSQRFAKGSVEVILDRRREQRRGRQVKITREQRRGDRRLRPELDKLLSSRSHVIVTVP
jgi:hypothetical protein